MCDGFEECYFTKAIIDFDANIAYLHYVLTNHLRRTFYNNILKALVYSSRSDKFMKTSYNKLQTFSVS